MNAGPAPRSYGCMTAQHVPLPRTRDHLQTCFALCTKCYVRRPAAMPAPFSATWDPHNLATQHFNCAAGSDALKTKTTTFQVCVCRSCAKLSPNELQARREERDEVALKATLRRRIRCFRCEKALTSKKRRWWVCAQGPHECHWAGHEA
ncbi:hypothetical protein VFPPC_17674 [Pochonia chlamydosporia 170]|uniref:Uncharacterized protein n=1 Tax=Pochonia chlamydosporia 170 TaxID=1380566 RepID=A0A219AQV6_METCM|nr:hypothetical protein VFPPC_17674 [Pochonia chlamydosporia 170]OWT43150.1 hypothetical protein VFPPC_17674 [Pochonia chlamydosporia 170]